MARRLSRNSQNAPVIHTPLFDRFESDRRATFDDLARDIADILGARRPLSRRVPGVLGWGLPGVTGMVLSSKRDRERVATLIAGAIERFEPRLEQVRVTPVDDTMDFAFVMEARLVQADTDSLRLRILSPRRGGALGADVTVLGV